MKEWFFHFIFLEIASVCTEWRVDKNSDLLQLVIEHKFKFIAVGPALGDDAGSWIIFQTTGLD